MEHIALVHDVAGPKRRPRPGATLTRIAGASSSGNEVTNRTGSAFEELRKPVQWWDCCLNLSASRRCGANLYCVINCSVNVPLTCGENAALISLHSRGNVTEWRRA